MWVGSRVAWLRDFKERVREVDGLTGSVHGDPKFQKDRARATNTAFIQLLL